MSQNVIALVFVDDEDPDQTVRLTHDLVVEIDPALAKSHGVDLDPRGFPTSASLEAWHRKNNPHLFLDDEE